MIPGPHLRKEEAKAFTRNEKWDLLQKIIEGYS